MPDPAGRPLYKPIRKPPAIPDPIPTIDSLMETVAALKQAVEILLGQTGGKREAAVRWQELINIGMIKEDQVPPKERGTHGV